MFLGYSKLLNISEEELFKSILGQQIMQALSYNEKMIIQKLVNTIKLEELKNITNISNVKLEAYFNCEDAYKVLSYESELFSGDKSYLIWENNNYLGLGFLKKEEKIIRQDIRNKQLLNYLTNLQKVDFTELDQSKLTSFDKIKLTPKLSSKYLKMKLKESNLKYLKSIAQMTTFEYEKLYDNILLSVLDILNYYDDSEPEVCPKQMKRDEVFEYIQNLTLKMAEIEGIIYNFLTYNSPWNGKKSESILVFHEQKLIKISEKKEVEEIKTIFEHDNLLEEKLKKSYLKLARKWNIENLVNQGENVEEPIS